MEQSGDLHPAVAELLKFKTAPQKSPEWYAIRNRMLTASDVAAAIGENPYESTTKLLRKKLGDNRCVFQGNVATRHGNLNEEIAADEYVRRTGKTCFEFGLIAHPLHAWLGGSPDRVTADGVLVEIKCPLKREIKHEIPAYYVPQVQVLMEILNLDMCHFVQFRPASTWAEMEFDLLEIKRDRNWFRQKLPLMQKFRDDWVEAMDNGGLEYLKTKALFYSSSSSGEDDDEKRANGKRKRVVEITIDTVFPFVDKPDARKLPRTSDDEVIVVQADANGADDEVDLNNMEQFSFISK